MPRASVEIRVELTDLVERDGLDGLRICFVDRADIYRTSFFGKRIQHARAPRGSSGASRRRIRPARLDCRRLRCVLILGRTSASGERRTFAKGHFRPPTASRGSDWLPVVLMVGLLTRVGPGPFDVDWQRAFQLDHFRPWSCWTRGASFVPSRQQGPLSCSPTARSPLKRLSRRPKTGAESSPSTVAPRVVFRQEARPSCRLGSVRFAPRRFSMLAG